MRSPGRFAALALFAVTCVAASSYADWPMARHDGKRTGAAPGKSDFALPVPYWRTYLGGSLGPSSFASADVDADGSNELLFGTGGRIVTKRQNDGPVCQTKPRGVNGIWAVVDVDGDGKLDVVSSNRDHAVVFSAQTGALEWVEPDGEMGTLGRVLVGDLDGDKKPEITSIECGCCGVNSGKTGFVYSFAGGFQSPKLLWTLPAVACGGGRSASLVDVDGDGVSEMFIGLYSSFQMLRGSDGLLLGQANGTGTWSSVNNCWHADLDAKAGDELVCLLSSSDLPATGQRKISVIQQSGGTLNVVWSKALAPDPGGDVALVNPIADLDGDGAVELVASGYDPNAGGWSLRVFDAMTGAESLGAAVVGYRYAGAVEADTVGQRIVLTSAGANVSAWTYQRMPQPALTQRWTVQDRLVVYTARRDWIAGGGPTWAAEPLNLDLTGDKLADVILSGATGPATLFAYAAPAGVTSVVGSYALPADTDILNTWAMPKTTMGPRLALARTDGVLTLLDGTLMPAKTGGEIPTALGIRIGGYYASGGWRELTDGPRTAALGTGPAESVVVQDSRTSLLRFDPAQASWAVPPPVVWAKSRTLAPTIAPGLDGAKRGIGVISYTQTRPPAYRVEALRADATSLWTVPIETSPMGDLVPANLNGDSTPDFVIQWGDPSDVVLRTRGLSGIDGATLWNATPISPGAGRQPAGVTIGHYDQDAIDDVVFQGAGTRVLSGTNGQPLALGGTGDSYFLPILYDTDSDLTEEVVLHAGYSPVRLYRHDLTTLLWGSADDDRPYPYGAVAQCPSAPVLVEGSLANSARLKLTPLSGALLGQYKTFVLAGGSLYANEGVAIAAGQYLGQLAEVSVHGNLTGKGRPTAVVGSSDGFVYGIDPCASALDFAVDLGVAAGEVAFGDTDGDGRDEIVVGAADGYLYGIKNRNVASPTNVIDTEPTAGNTTMDVDTITGTGSLSGAWSAVAGATGYEILATTEKGVPLLSAWQSTGAQTSGTISGLSLQQGSKYFFAVRALSLAGPSVDVTSDGVTVGALAWDGGAGDADTTDGGADAGDTFTNRGGGCGCAVDGAPDPWAPAGLAGAAGLLLVAAVRRRARVVVGPSRARPASRRRGQ